MDVFCQINKNELPAVKIWENDEFVAILDVNPYYDGTTLVITKEHYSSDITKMPEDVLSRFVLAAKEVMTILEQKLQPKRVVLVVEGLGVDHAHIKLYPIQSLEEGYTTTKLGEPRTIQELTIIAEKIKN